MRHLAKRDMKESTKCNYQKAVQLLFKWQREARNRDIEWEPEIEYSDPSTAYQPREYLTEDDRRAMREAAMSYGSIPHYNGLTPEERSRWKKHLAQRLQKPESKVTKQDFLQANSFKYTSMIYTALDAGFRPIEVQRANIHWLDLDNGVLRIPEEESSKSRENWIVALKPETVSILKKWKEERNAKPKYDGQDALWLTQQGNRYNKDTFRRSVFRKIAKEAGLDLENRDLTPYSIRHSTATMIAKEADLATAAKQCRHKSKQTTQKYAHSSVDRQEDAVNNNSGSLDFVFFTGLVSDWLLKICQRCLSAEPPLYVCRYNVCTTGGCDVQKSQLPIAGRPRGEDGCGRQSLPQEPDRDRQGSAPGIPSGSRGSGGIRGSSHRTLP